jgi:hypothetical protein
MRGEWRLLVEVKLLGEKYLGCMTGADLTRAGKGE